LKTGKFIKKTIICSIFLIFIGTAVSSSINKVDFESSNKILENYNFHLNDLKVVSIPFTQQSQIGELINHHVDIVDLEESNAIAYVNDIQLKWLYDYNFNPVILFNNLKEMNDVIHSSDILDFHNYAQMTAALQTIADTYPSITQLYDLGHSVQGRVIWGLKVTDNPTIEEDEPEVRICGVHHGNEYMGGELSLLLAQNLTENYGINSLITDFVDNREIWIIPFVNPDGRESGSRYNANGVDLNRDYGYMWGSGWDSPAPFSQPETQAIRANALENNFVLSLSYHCSETIVNYVWNYKHMRVPDNTVVEYLSYLYASHNSYEVIDGYDWYQTRGDTNDFSYGCRGDLDWTIETPNSNIPLMWQLHGPAIFDFIAAADTGLRGIVTDADSGQPIAATIWVDEANWPCFTDPVIGDYHKILKSGTYTVHFRANGYIEQTHTVNVIANDPTVLDVALEPENNHYAYQVTLCSFYDPFNYPNNFQNNPTEAISALGPPDDICASLGVGGYIVLDMGEEGTIVDHENETDFKIFEGDATQDGYTVYVSSNWSGPWIDMGQVLGTAEFDLANVSVESAQFVKIVDDNDGSATEQNPGVDIDAVQHLVHEIIPPNNPPSTPEINGTTKGKVGTQLTYKFVSIDPDGDDVYYYIFWGDGNYSGWLGPYNSSVEISVNYSWSEMGTYTIKAKAKDVHGNESSWATLEVKIPRSREFINSRLLQILERFPLLAKFISLID